MWRKEFVILSRWSLWIIGRFHESAFYLCMKTHTSSFKSFMNTHNVAIRGSLVRLYLDFFKTVMEIQCLAVLSNPIELVLVSTAVWSQYWHIYHKFNTTTNATRRFKQAYTWQEAVSSCKVWSLRWMQYIEYLALLHSFSPFYYLVIDLSICIMASAFFSPRYSSSYFALFIWFLLIGGKFILPEMSRRRRHNRRHFEGKNKTLRTMYEYDLIIIWWQKRVSYTALFFGTCRDNCYVFEMMTLWRWR